MNRAAPAIHIERLDLDLRGIAPATANAAVQALGPALQRALLADSSPGAAADAAGAALVVPAGASPSRLAQAMAVHLAGIIRREAASASPRTPS